MKPPRRHRFTVIQTIHKDNPIRDRQLALKLRSRAVSYGLNVFIS